MLLPAQPADRQARRAEQWAAGIAGIIVEGADQLGEAVRVGHWNPGSDNQIIAV
jgi:hypothetical protein